MLLRLIRLAGHQKDVRKSDLGVEVECENVRRASIILDGVAIAADGLEHCGIKMMFAAARERARRKRLFQQGFTSEDVVRSDQKRLDVDRLAVGRVQLDGLIGSLAGLIARGGSS